MLQYHLLLWYMKAWSQYLRVIVGFANEASVEGAGGVGGAGGVDGDGGTGR